MIFVDDMVVGFFRDVDYVFVDMGGNVREYFFWCVVELVFGLDFFD